MAIEQKPLSEAERRVDSIIRAAQRWTIERECAREGVTLSESDIERCLDSIEAWRELSAETQWQETERRAALNKMAPEMIADIVPRYAVTAERRLGPNATARAQEAAAGAERLRAARIAKETADPSGGQRRSPEIAPGALGRTVTAPVRPSAVATAWPIRTRYSRDHAERLRLALEAAGYESES